MIKKGFIASFLLQKVLFSDGFCAPKPQRLRRFVISPLSARLCLFLLSLSSSSKDLSKILRRRAKLTAENHTVLPTFAVLTVFSVFFAPDWKKPNVSCETFGFFLLSCFLAFFLSFSARSLSLFLAFVFFPVFFSSFYALFWAFFCFLRFSGDFWARFS